MMKLMKSHFFGFPLATFRSLRTGKLQFIIGLPWFTYKQMVIFHSYVSLPEGNYGKLAMITWYYEILIDHGRPGTGNDYHWKIWLITINCGK